MAMSISTRPFESLVELGSVSITGPVALVKKEYEAKFGAEPVDRGGWYRPDDWARIAYTLSALHPGGRFLDVGLGAGQFVNSVAMSGWFDEVHGVDPTKFKKYLDLTKSIQRSGASIDQLPYPDDHFDVVTCMEVLEHLEPAVFEAGLAELRRVCRGQLIMSVPFDEPEPIYVGHRRRFTRRDLVREFPEASRAMLFKLTVPWALLEEWHGITRSADAVSPPPPPMKIGLSQRLVASARIAFGPRGVAALRLAGRVRRKIRPR